MSFDIKFTKALRTLVESRGLPSDSTCVLEAEPGERKPGILFFSLQADSLFKLAVTDKLNSKLSEIDVCRNIFLFVDNCTKLSTK